MPHRNPELSSRKTPKQDRARATVAAILDAAAYILARDGWEKLNTNRIAERAGVNIASLYQYFPSKEAIAVELQARHGRQVRERVHSALSNPGASKTLRDLLTGLVRAGIEEHQVNPSLHRALTEDLPRGARRPESRDASAATSATWRAQAAPYLRGVPDLDLADFVARVAAHAVIHEAAVRRPDLLQRPGFAAEVVALLERYLRRPPARNRSPHRSGDATPRRPQSAKG